MKINWLAPLPPAKTGVAFYCRDLLPLLTERAEVRCWTPQETWDREVEAWVEVATLEDNEAFWRELNRADLTICHLGNNPFAFGEILEIASRHPSLVVLHKPRLFELFLGIACEIRHDPALFRRQLTDRYGRGAERVLESLQAVDRSSRQEFAGLARRRADGLRRAELALRYPFTDAAIENALGVFCHHPHAAEQVRASGWPGPLTWQHLAAGPTTERAPENRERHRPERRRMLTFGHFPIDHMLGPLLDALARYPRRRLLHLDVFGEIPDFADLVAKRDRLALHDEVLFHGFVVEPFLLETLASADLALNLRPPTASASAVQLQIWRHGVPSLTLAENTLDDPLPASRTIRGDFWQADLHQAWDDLLDAPGTYAPLAHAGRIRLERDHRPEAYLDALLAFAEECRGSLEDNAWRRLERRRRQLLRS